MTRLVNPIPLFSDGRGGLLDAGSIWIGEAGTDPEIEANQLALFWDKEMTVPAAQPLRTLGGEVVQGGNLGLVYFAEPNFSFTKRDANGNLITYISDAFDLGATAYQPLDGDLSAIAGLGTTAFGRDFNVLADAAAARTKLALGTSATQDIATSAEFRSDTPNKILDTDGVWGAATSVALVQSGGSIPVDLNTGLNFTLLMASGPWSLSTPTNGKDGQSGKIEITQDALGSRVLIYGVGWIFAGGSAPVLSTAANARDVLFYEVLADGKVLGSLVKGLA